MIEKAIRDLRRIWGPLDPAPTVKPSDITAQDAALATILATTRSPAGMSRSRPTRWRVAGVAGIAALVVAVVTAAVAITFNHGPPAYATPAILDYAPVTDDRSTAQRLTQIALAAQADNRVTSPNSTEHLLVVSWDLYTEIDGQDVRSAVVPVQRESWRSADDSGLVVERYLPPTFNSEEQRRAWRDQDSPGADQAPRSNRYGVGEFPARWRGRPPAEPDALQDWLRHNANGADDAMSTAVALHDLLRERVLTGAERAALLQVLARRPDIEYKGAVTDRAGRRGQAFSLTSSKSGLPTTYTFIWDPTNGEVLAFEKMLTGSAGKLDLKTPAVIGYDTYRLAEHVSSR